MEHKEHKECNTSVSIFEKLIRNINLRSWYIREKKFDVIRLELVESLISSYMD
jgi:hypothetical protein